MIADVRDNIRNPKSPVKSYQIVHGGLEDDVLAFVDRFHQWNGFDSNGLPKFLAGADYIMPFNDDKFVGGLELKVRLLRPATLYVFLDNNMAVPDWLREGFTDTGIDIGLDCSKTEWHRDHSLGVGPGRSVDFRFSVWKREVKEPGTVSSAASRLRRYVPRASTCTASRRLRHIDKEFLQKICSWLIYGALLSRWVVTFLARDL